jgi:hypothetical protein
MKIAEIRHFKTPLFGCLLKMRRSMRSPLALDGQDVLMAALTDGVDARADEVEIARSQLAAAGAVDAGGKPDLDAVAEVGHGRSSEGRLGSGSRR